MKFLFMIAGMLSATNASNTGDDCATKINDAFAGNERYWRKIPA